MGKRYILFPSLLVIYTIVMAVMAFPKYQESGKWAEYLIVLGGSLLIALLLYFILKRKQTLRDKFSGRG
jgi:LPXTG-motif cell wall-anchored protein